MRESFYQYIQYREQKEFIGFHPFDSDSLNAFNIDQVTESEEPSAFPQKNIQRLVSIIPTIWTMVYLVIFNSHFCSNNIPKDKGCQCTC